MASKEEAVIPVPEEGTTAFTTGRGGCTLSGQLGKTDKRSEYFPDKQGHRIPCFCRPKQKREPKEINFSNHEKATVSLEVENLMKKGAVKQVCPQKYQFLRNIFIVRKRHKDNRPAISLKVLSKCIPFRQLKM